MRMKKLVILSRNGFEVGKELSIESIGAIDLYVT